MDQPLANDSSIHIDKGNLLTQFFSKTFLLC